MFRELTRLAAIGLYAFALPAARSMAGAPPSFYKDVLPILQQHCQSCHRPGEPTPMSLLDYAGTKPWARTILEAVTSHQMPPWYADSSVGRFANDRSLSSAEIQTICAWVAAGVPEGAPQEAPKPIHWVDGWSIGQPEMVFEVPTDFHVPVSGIVPYQYAIVPTHFTKDTWVRLAEVRPGDREHAHHIVVSARTGFELARRRTHGRSVHSESPRIGRWGSWRVFGGLWSWCYARTACSR
jgi:mono/diheme cytochrome c family protein